MRPNCHNAASNARGAHFASLIIDLRSDRTADRRLPNDKRGDPMIVRNFAITSAASLLLGVLPVRGADVLRIAMTASDIPTANGMPNNGFEGMRFLGYPIFESLVLWDLSRAERLADLRPGLASSYEQAPTTRRPGFFTCGTASSSTTAPTSMRTQ
jgi:hypothetical protein